MENYSLTGSACMHIIYILWFDVPLHGTVVPVIVNHWCYYQIWYQNSFDLIATKQVKVYHRYCMAHALSYHGEWVKFQNNAVLVFPTSKLNSEQLTGQMLFFTLRTVKQSEKLEIFASMLIPLLGFFFFFSFLKYLWFC